MYSSLATPNIIIFPDYSCIGKNRFSKLILIIFWFNKRLFAIYKHSRNNSEELDLPRPVPRSQMSWCGFKPWYLQRNFFYYPLDLRVSLLIHYHIRLIINTPAAFKTVRITSLKRSSLGLILLLSCFFRIGFKPGSLHLIFGWSKFSY